jgi:ribonuclease T2
MKNYAGIIALAALSLVALWYTWQPPTSDRPQTTSTLPTTIAQPGAPSSRPQSRQQNTPEGKGFDFYVLSLSWSPTFCQSAAGASSRQQCGTDRRYGFVVHGLWPQNEKGYPEFCASSESERVPDNLGRSVFDIMPSMGLIGHQWRKHGACSGLNQKDYFATTRAAFQSVKLPTEIASGQRSVTLSTEAVEAAFVAANPGMSRQGIAISCDRQKLEEVRICLNKDLSFRDCREVDRQGCRANAAEITPIR